MSEQLCKDCSHAFKFHYKANDGKTHCSKCNEQGMDCYAFTE